MHLSEIWHSKKNDSRLSRTLVSMVVSRIVHLVARLLPQLCEKDELVGVVSHILEAG